MLAMNHGSIVLHLIHIDDATLGKENALAETEHCGIEDRDLRRAGADVGQRTVGESSCIELGSRPRIAESQLIQKQGSKGVSKVKADLLVAARNIDNLPLRGGRWAKKSLVCCELLLEDISGKKAIFVGELEINSPGTFVVIERL